MADASAPRVALITGAGRRGGLGQAIAHRLVRDGIAIMLHDRGAVEGDIAPAHGVGTVSDLHHIWRRRTPQPR
jgi:meso-butanediol dehydrogenase/(S,S)-butanediol dehydrogenase/diacetyl reductase